MENTLITENNMDLEVKYELVRSIGEECINEDELKSLLDKKELPVHMMDLNLPEECILLKD